MKTIYLGSKLLFKQVLWKTMERCSFINFFYFFKSPAYFSGVGIRIVKELSQIFCPSPFDYNFLSSSEVV